ncbi:hypothetical protein QRD90_22505 [Peribacillus frigoritolerans]|uniref:hypothetical protein n=1 Tax=Peribacillus frigoritolerans TaxID=450367 RepID=UPI00207A7551|nr:hypothetical protein [Peribacillus frigoritolerans]USK79653.1 hypothetical protein LHV56_22955 [Peribacillus frigoritolerans]WJE46939.1 hypothetical protein QRD90_22505 [Peribacillus frigoritolerans]
MKWEHIADRMTIFSVILFLSPYLDRMGNSYWPNLLYIVVLVLGIDFTLSKIKFLQKSVTKKAGWSILTTGCIFVGVLHNLIFS